MVLGGAGERVLSSDIAWSNVLLQINFDIFQKIKIGKRNKSVQED